MAAGSVFTTPMDLSAAADPGGNSVRMSARTGGFPWMTVVKRGSTEKTAAGLYMDGGMQGFRLNSKVLPSMPVVRD